MFRGTPRITNNQIHYNDYCKVLFRLLDKKGTLIPYGITMYFEDKIKNGARGVDLQNDEYERLIMQLIGNGTIPAEVNGPKTVARMLFETIAETDILNNQILVPSAV